MLGLPRRYAHFVFGVLQSGLTSAVAAAVASFGAESFASHWLHSWLLAWGLMLPLVIFAAPLLRALAYSLTRE